jgi:hypothetical protein
MVQKALSQLENKLVQRVDKLIDKIPFAKRDVKEASKQE